MCYSVGLSNMFYIWFQGFQIRLGWNCSSVRNVALIGYNRTHMLVIEGSKMHDVVGVKGKESIVLDVQVLFL